MLLVIDERIQDRYQKFSEWSQVQFNKNCYWWAYICTHISGISCLLVVALRMGDLGWDLKNIFAQDGIDLFITSLYVLISLQEMRWLSARKKRATATQPQPPILDPIKTKTVRIILLMLGILNLFILPLGIETALPFVWASIWYFEFCVPLPPNEVEQKQLAKKRVAAAH